MEVKNKRTERITGERIYLRPITIEDTADIIRWRNSDAVRPYFIYQKPFTREGHLNWLKTMIDSGKGYQFMVCRKEDDQPIGSTYLRDYDPISRKAEYGVFLGEEEERGKGIGKEILELTLQFAFKELHLHKVFARAFSDNMPSIQSFLRCGFEKEALLKDEEYINGEYRDLVFLAKFNPEEWRDNEKESKFCNTVL